MTGPFDNRYGEGARFYECSKRQYHWGQAPPSWEDSQYRCWTHNPSPGKAIAALLPMLSSVPGRLNATVSTGKTKNILRRRLGDMRAKGYGCHSWVCPDLMSLTVRPMLLAPHGRNALWLPRSATISHCNFPSAVGRPTSPASGT